MLGSSLIVLPTLSTKWARRTIDSLREPERSTSLLVIDNGARPLPVRLQRAVWRHERAGHNLGVPGSWNRGIAALDEHDARWLVIVSEAIEFEDGGAAWLDALDEHDVAVWSPYGFHLAAIERSTIEQVGPFDEGFAPGYFEDSDYLRRMACEGLMGTQLYEVPGVRDHGEAHSIKEGLVHVEFGPLTQRYRDKWGGPPGAERFARPWGET